MTELLQQAFARARALGEKQQDEIAETIMAILEILEVNEEIAPEDLPHVLKGLAQANRGEFVPQEEMDAFFARYLK